MKIAEIKVPIEWEYRIIKVIRSSDCPYFAQAYGQYNDGRINDYCTYDPDLEEKYCDGPNSKQCPLKESSE